MSAPDVRPEVFDGLLACREILDAIVKATHEHSLDDPDARFGVVTMLAIIRSDALRAMATASEQGRKTELIATADMLTRWLEVCSTALSAEELADPDLLYREIDDLVAAIRRKWDE